MSKYNQLAQNTIIFALGNVLSKLILSLLLPLYTRVLTTAEYGAAELITSYSQLIIPLASLSIGDAVFRYTMDREFDSRTVITNSYLVLGIGTVLLFVLTPLLYLVDSIGEYGLYLVLISVFSMWRSVFSLYTKATGKSVRFAADNILFNLFLAVSNIMLLTVFHLRIQGYFLSQVIANIVSILFLACTNRLTRLSERKFSKLLLRRMLTYSMPLVFNSISWGIMGTADRVMLTSMVDNSATGIYSAAAKIPSFLSLITGVFTQAWSLAVIKDYEAERDNVFYENIFKFIHISVSIGALFLFLCNNWFFTWLFGKEFEESVRYIPCLLIGTVFLTYSNYLSPFFSAIKNTKMIMISAIVGALVNVVMNYTLIPAFGIMGACMATACSYAVIMAIRFLVSQRSFRLRYDVWKLLATQGILLISAVLITLRNKFSYVVASMGVMVVMSLYIKDLKMIVGKLMGSSKA